MSRLRRIVLESCFFLSGGAGLVYQVVWGRRLAALFGSTLEGVSVVLAVFMAGLGAGAFVLGRRADASGDPGRLYGLLELLVGGFGALSLPILSLAGGVFEAAASSLSPGALLVLLKTGVAFLVLFVPCFLMGGTLPALVRAFTRGETETARPLGVLYALNLAGAVSGALLAGFVLVEALGLLRTTAAAAAVNVLAGAAVLATGTRSRTKGSREALRPSETPRADGPRSARETVLLAGLFVSGALVFAAEVVFTRVLSLVFGVSTYAFTLILGTFLLGLGLGAFALARLGRRGVTPGAAFALAQGGLALTVLGALAAVPAVPRAVLLIRQIPEAGFFEVLVGKAVLAVVLILPAAVFGGIGTPALLAALAAEPARSGRRVGDGYFANCAGTVAGALLTGFVAIPSLGTEGTLRAVAIGGALTGIAALAAAARGWRLRGGAIACAAAAAASFLVPVWPVSLFLNADAGGRIPVSATRREFEERLRAFPYEVLFFREGREATVAIVQAPRYRSLIVNGHPDASDSDDMSTQLMLSVLPVGLHPDPRDVLVIGYGAGVSARAAARSPGVKRVDVVEIEPAVLDAAPLFGHVNGGVETDPRVRVVRDDARAFVGRTRQTWDVVVSEPSNPWRAGVAALYSADFYRDLKSRLKPGGLVAQWMHLYDLDAPTLRIVFRTLTSSFADVNVWWLDEGNIVLLASDAPLVLRPERLRALLDGPFREERIRYSKLESADEVWGRFLLDRAGILAMLSPADPVNSDDRPVLEFRAPRGAFRPDPVLAERLLARKLASGVSLPHVEGAEPPEAARWLGVATMYEQVERGAEAAAAIRRAAAGPSPFARIRLAELALAGRRMREAAELLTAVAPAVRPGDPDLLRVFSFAEARTLASQGQLEPARVAWERTGEIEGRAGLELLSFLVASRQDAAALPLAERLLTAARLGGPVGAPEVLIVYDYLGEVATDPARLEEVLRIVRSVPDVSRGLPQLPRQRFLAALWERTGRPDEALAACERAADTGVFDVDILAIRARALRALGRLAEAAQAEAVLESVAPGQTLSPVRSPLLGTGSAGPLPRASGPRPRRGGS